MSQFRKDLKEARKTEQLVFELLCSLDKQYKYKLVNESPEYYHKGDILASAADGTEIFIDVKCDSRIAETGRILCEEENYFYNTDTVEKGFMYSDYDYLCIVSYENRTFYFIDFKKLKEIYQMGEFKRIYHPE